MATRKPQTEQKAAAKSQPKSVDVLILSDTYSIGEKLPAGTVQTLPADDAKKLVADGKADDDKAAVDAYRG